MGVKTQAAWEREEGLHAGMVVDKDVMRLLARSR